MDYMHYSQSLVVVPGAGRVQLQRKDAPDN